MQIERKLYKSFSYEFKNISDVSAPFIVKWEERSVLLEQVKSKASYQPQALLQIIVIFFCIFF